MMTVTDYIKLISEEIRSRQNEVLLECMEHCGKETNAR